MKSFLLKIFGIFFIFLFTNGIAQTKPCIFETIQNGVLSFNSSINTLTGLKNNTVHLWQFDGIKGKTYSFNIIQDKSNSLFFYRVLDENYQSKNLIFDNNSNNFIHYVCDSSSIYTFYLSPKNCYISSDLDLQYYSEVEPKPTVTGFLGNPTIRDKNITLVGLGFKYIKKLGYNYTYGTSWISSEYLGSKTDTIIINNSYNFIEEGKMKLSGAFGIIETPYFKYVSKTPIITGIYPESGTINGQISILGSDFEDVRNIQFFGQNYSYNYQHEESNKNHILTNVYSFAMNGVISLTGYFGIVTVSAPNMFVEPIIISDNNGYNPIEEKNVTTLFGKNLTRFISINYVTFENEIRNLNIISSVNDELNEYIVVETPYNCINAIFTITSGFGITTVSLPNLVAKPPKVNEIMFGEVKPGDYNYLRGEGFELIQDVFYKDIFGKTNAFSLGYYRDRNLFEVRPNMASGFLTISGYFGLKEIPMYQKVTYPRPFITKSDISITNSVTLTGRNFNSIDKIYCETNKGKLMVYSFWRFSMTSDIIFTLPNSVLSGNITLTGGFGSIISRIKIKPIIETPVTTSIVYNVTKKQNYGLLISGTGLNFVEKIYYHTKYGINSKSKIQGYDKNLIQYYINDIYQGNITLTGAFGKVIAPYITPDICRNRIIFQSGLEISSTPSKTYVIKNKLHFWTFTGVALTNYKFKISKNAMIFIYDKHKNLVLNNYFYDSLIWNCTKNEMYYVSVRNYDECSSLNDDVILTYNTFEMQPKPIVSKAILDNRIYKLYFTGTGLNTISEILYNSENGINKYIYFQTNNDNNEIIIYTHFNYILAGNLTLVGTFGMMDVPLEIISREEIVPENEFSISPVSQDLLIYPNPTYGRFYIESNISSFVKIYDTNGNLTYQSSEENFTHIIEIETEGVYIVEVAGVRKKVIVKRDF